MRLAKCGVGFLLTCCVQHILLVYCPTPLFAYQHTHKNFTVHMREEIPPEITGVLDRVDRLLAAADLNDETQHHEIYIINSFALSRFLLLRNVHFGCNLPNGNTYVTSADVVNDVARCETISPDDRRIRTLSETITHEIVHALIRNRVGWRADQRLPAWIKEGYCEFVADGSAIDHRTGLKMLKSVSGDFTPGLQNFRWRLMIEYLIAARRMTIHEIIRHPPTYRLVESEVIAALRGDEAALLERLGSRIATPRPRPGETPGGPESR